MLHYTTIETHWPAYFLSNLLHSVFFMSMGMVAMDTKDVMHAHNYDKLIIIICTVNITGCLGSFDLVALALCNTHLSTILLSMCDCKAEIGLHTIAWLPWRMVWASQILFCHMK